MNTRDLQDGLSLIRKDFNLDRGELSIPDAELSKELLLERLSRLIAYLMEKDFSKLLQVLYRIDVSEEKLKSALAGNAQTPSDTIAQMIFEREMQKVETRKRYRS